MSHKFSLQAPYSPSQAQQSAIDYLCEGIEQGQGQQALLGVTGSGKTFTMANVIAQLNRPTLIMTHNKTLTAQLYAEFKEFFPDNAVEYFVSYYDYYQPEAYVPSSDLFIDKETSINDDLDKLRLAATRALFEREDVIIVSSVSCIYGLGSPEVYSGMLLYFMEGAQMPRKEMFSRLVGIRYERNNMDLHRGTFRVRGDVVDIFPAYGDTAIRVELFGDTIDSLFVIDPLTGQRLEQLSKYALYPASHYVMPEDMLPKTLEMIEAELVERLAELRQHNKLLEAQRLEQRTRFDLEMLAETGTCPGVENYSRIMTRRGAGEAPPTLIDYFPKKSLLFLDESHVTVPQVGAMYKGDYRRKENLVDYGFRLPSAYDNRPLKFAEFEQLTLQTVYVSATLGDYELEKSKDRVVEQILRPTGLLDPRIDIQPADGQIDHLLEEIRTTTQQGDRVLITTLTKRMAEDLTEYYQDLGVRIRYLHSEIDTIERTEIIRSLRLGEFDVLVGINLLREGLDIPEVGLIGILDADKEGFLRSRRSLLQICGRAARNVRGRVIMYADGMTDSMRLTLAETQRRRLLQEAYNTEQGITPQSIAKKVQGSLIPGHESQTVSAHNSGRSGKKGTTPGEKEDRLQQIKRLEQDMQAAARKLQFEKAAELRDELRYLKELDLGIVQ